MNIIAGIDGTGSAVTPGAGRDAEYDVAFANSFVTRIARRGVPNSAYWRGPVAGGGGLVPAINGALSYITQRLRTSRGMNQVLLTGYSRGAAGIVSLAKRLQDEDIDVNAMLLFDCVDRHMFIDADVIPNNVQHVLHLVRDPASSSRESFDNDGLRYRPPTQIQAYRFLCTHGGMGGCPWTTPIGHRPTDMIDEGGYDGITTISYVEDARVSARIWEYVQPFCRRHGFL